MKRIVFLLTFLSMYACGASQEADLFNKAAEEGNIKLMQQMLSAKPGLVDARDRMWLTPIMNATFNQKYDAVEFLLMNGADIDSQDAFGATALNMAVGTVDPAMVKLLLRHEADISLGKNKKETPYVRVVNYINAHGTSYEQSGRRGHMPKINWETKQKNLQEIKKLLEQHGARSPEEKKK